MLVAEPKQDRASLGSLVSIEEMWYAEELSYLGSLLTTTSAVEYEDVFHFDSYLLRAPEDASESILTVVFFWSPY